MLAARTTRTNCKQTPPFGACTQTDGNTAECDVYLRLRELDLFKVSGARIPQIFSNRDDLWCIEMQIVAPPFVLDFAGASLDTPPDYPADVMEGWRREKQEQYGDDRPWVEAILREWAGIGVFLADVKPGNITLR